MNSIVGAVMTWAMKKEIDKDPEFKRKLQQYNQKIADLSKDIENDFEDIKSRHRTKD